MSIKPEGIHAFFNTLLLAMHAFCRKDAHLRAAGQHHLNVLAALNFAMAPPRCRHRPMPFATTTRDHHC